MNKAALGGTRDVAVKQNSQKQQQTGLTRELLKIQHGSRPVVILDGPRNSRLRSSLSSVESSPATAALEKYRQEASKQSSSTIINKELKDSVEAVKKAKTGERKPFEKLLASATNSNDISKATTSLTKNPVEMNKSANHRHITNNSVIEDENIVEITKHSRSKPIDDSSDSPILTPFTTTANIHPGGRSASANVFHFY